MRARESQLQTSGERIERQLGEGIKPVIKAERRMNKKKRFIAHRERERKGCNYNSESTHTDTSLVLLLYVCIYFMKMNECLQGPMKFYGGRKIFIEMVGWCNVALLAMTSRK